MARQFFPAVAVRAASAFRSKPPSVVSPADAVAAPQALPKQKRLAKRREFLRVYEKGRKLSARFSVLFVAANELPYSRLGITATKKLGKATVRNKLKRWTREIYRKQRVPLGLDSRSVDVVVNVKVNAAEVSFVDYTRDLTRALERVAAEKGA